MLHRVTVFAPNHGPLLLEDYVDLTDQEDTRLYLRLRDMQEEKRIGGFSIQPIRTTYMPAFIRKVEEQAQLQTLQALQTKHQAKHPLPQGGKG